jgi:Uma2 family endonuclease
LGNRACFVEAPELCIEIISPSNSDEEIREKIALYFDAGAEEVWTCGSFGQMTFFGRSAIPIPTSKLCPEFPASI